MKKIVVEVSDSYLIEYGIELAKHKVAYAIMKLLNDDKFIYYVAKQLSNNILRIALRETSNIGSDVMSGEEINDYLNGFEIAIENNLITIYNASVIDTTTKNISPEKRLNYPPRLSLAKLIEYGFGYTGFANTQELPPDWAYDVNQHGYRGWYYEDKAGQLHWTNGMEGRLVFLKLCWWLEENFADIVNKYLRNNL
jgi:hypothetical protein